MDYSQYPHIVGSVHNLPLYPRSARAVSVDGTIGAAFRGLLFRTLGPNLGGHGQLRTVASPYFDYYFLHLVDHQNF